MGTKMIQPQSFISAKAHSITNSNWLPSREYARMKYKQSQGLRVARYIYKDVEFRAENPLDRELKISPPDVEHGAGNPLDETSKTESPVRTRHLTLHLEDLETGHMATLLKDLQTRQPDTFLDFWRGEEVSMLNDGWNQDSKTLCPQRKESAKDPDNAIARLVKVTPIHDKDPA